MQFASLRPKETILTSTFASLPVRGVTADLSDKLGPCEMWRHSVGQGGFSPRPLPERAQKGLAKIKPRLVRVFLQEYFDLYPEHGKFNWKLLDAFMDSVAATGAKAVATICFKPRTLYPKIDHDVWEPNDRGEWQRLLYELSKRYSAEKDVVAYWEIANEPNYGDAGGTPFRIRDPQQYAQFYELTAKPIIDACPTAKVGGTSNAWLSEMLSGSPLDDEQPLMGFLDYCRENGTRLDFVSWHAGPDNPAFPGDHAEAIRRRLKGYPKTSPELMVTEWSVLSSRPHALVPHSQDVHEPRFPQLVSVEEMVFEPYHVADVAGAVLDMVEAGVDWSFAYQIFDDFVDLSEWERFLGAVGREAHHREFNELPWRVGFFDWEGNPRPWYFLYLMLNKLDGDRIAASSNHPDMKVLAAYGNRRASCLIVNHDCQGSRDAIAQLRFEHLARGTKYLRAYRIDSNRRWSTEELELIPTESRQVWSTETFHCQVFSPAHSVTLVELEDL